MEQVDIAQASQLHQNEAFSKKKRAQCETESPSEAAAARDSPVESAQATIQDICRDLEPSLLERISSSLPQSHDRPQQSAKRQKLSESDTIIDKIEARSYTSLQDFEVDVRVAVASLYDSLTHRSLTDKGKPTWTFTIGQEELEKRQLAAHVKALEQRALGLISREKAHNSNKSAEVKAEEVEGGLGDTTSEQVAGQTVLTLLGSAQGPRQLFSSAPRRIPLAGVGLNNIDPSLAEGGIVPLRENGLPNNIFSTKILPVSVENVATARKGQTFVDIFAPPPNVPQLQPPKSRNGQGRGETLSWASDKVSRGAKRLGYAFEKLPAAKWLGYGGVVHTQEPTSPEAKRKRRDRALSTGEAVLTPSEGQKAAHLQAKEEALFRSAYSSFAPSRDNSGALIAEGDKSQIWWERTGRACHESLFAVTSESLPEHEEPEDDADMERAFAQAVDEFEPISYQPGPTKTKESLAELETQQLLTEISEMLETLHSHQRIRNASLSGNPKSSISPSPSMNDLTGTPSTPASAELLLHETLKQQLALLVSFLPPYAVAKLNGDQLDELNISRHLPMAGEDYRGVMDEDQGSRLARQAALQAAVGAANTSVRPISSSGSYGSKQMPTVGVQNRTATGGYAGYSASPVSRPPSNSRQPLSNWQTPRPNYTNHNVTPTSAMQINRPRPSVNYHGARPQINGYGHNPGTYQQRPPTYPASTSGFAMGSPVTRQGSPQGYQNHVSQPPHPGTNSHAQFMARPGSSYMNESPKLAPSGYPTPAASSVNSAPLGSGIAPGAAVNGSRPHSPASGADLASKAEQTAQKASTSHAVV